MPLSFSSLPARSVPVLVRASLAVVITLLATALGLWAAPDASQNGVDVDGPWEDVLRTRYTAASKKFERRHAANPSDTRLAIAHAAALLTRDPMTRGNVRKARATLEKVLAELPADEAELRPLALLLLGRIDHDHIEPPQFERAREYYEQLRREYPGHRLADQAAVQLVQLLRLAGGGAPAAAALLEQLLPSMLDPEARVRLHMIASNLYLNPLRDERASIRHLQAALELGSKDTSIHLKIGWIARKIGDHQLSAEHYRTFAAVAPRDTRAYTSRRLAREQEELAKSAAAPAANLPSPRS